jgi:two-component system response regulator YesN
MPFKVFFVEDEIVTREGIRDYVDWKAAGFEFCGEAPDGEMALPFLQSIKPHVLITDIKMPFMDGLQLCKIVREHMPGMKIIILSGHDEFEYAQQAIKLGVTEYLLKPVTVEDLENVLHKIAVQLERERLEQEKLQILLDQIDENQAILRERLLLKLVVGAISPTEAIEKGQQFGLDLIARCYLVLILRTELGDRSEKFDYDEYQQVQRIVSGLVENKPDTFLLRKDWEELVLLMKGSTPEYMEEERDMLLQSIKQEVSRTRYHLTIGAGAPKMRMADIYQSFVEALVSIQIATDQDKAVSNHPVDRAELLKVDQSAVENYLRGGKREDFDAFFNTYIQPLGDTALKSYLIKNYIFVDVVLATAKLVSELGGDIDTVVPELNSIETLLANIKTIDQLREQARLILVSALAFRDHQSSNSHRGTIQKAKDYIDHHYMDENLSLSEVVAWVNLSASHFSMVFSDGTNQTFKEYLTEIRINKAKELLRTTALRSAEISYQVGYRDPHYFSYVFRKNTGVTPSEFRSQIRVG